MPSLLPWAGRTLVKIESPISQEISFSQEKRSLDIPMLQSWMPTKSMHVRQLCSLHIGNGEYRSAADYGYTQMFRLGTLPPPPRRGQHLLSPHVPISPSIASNRSFKDRECFEFDRNSWTLRKQRMFSASDGNIILGHEDVLSGNHIVMLQRVNVPLILRRTAEDVYRVLGPCDALERYKKEQIVADESFTLVEGSISVERERLAAVDQATTQS
jgi:hypothetical protein